MPAQRNNTVVEIHLDHLKHNISTLQKLSPSDFFLPMVKANAYGHGAVAVAKVCLEMGVKRLGVMLFSEAKELKEAGIAADILVFDKMDVVELVGCVEAGFVPVIHSLDQLSALRKKQLDCRVHVKFNTGMNRLGIPMGDLKAVASEAGPGIQIEGVLTHLLEGDEPISHAQQTQLFRQVVAEFPQAIPHVYNTPGLLWASEHNKLEPSWGCRLGGALYGLATSRALVDLRPVMSLKTHIVQLQRIEPGETVSYNGTWKAERTSTIAVLPIGYADGFSRHHTNKSKAFVKGQQVDCIGTVCMDFTMLDVTDIEASEGDSVELFGANLHPDHVADGIGTSPYTLTTCVSPRIPKVLRGNV